MKDNIYVDKGENIKKVLSVFNKNEWLSLKGIIIRLREVYGDISLTDEKHLDTFMYEHDAYFKQRQMLNVITNRISKHFCVRNENIQHYAYRKEISGNKHRAEVNRYLESNMRECDLCGRQHHIHPRSTLFDKHLEIYEYYTSKLYDKYGAKIYDDKFYLHTKIRNLWLANKRLKVK